MLQVALRVRVVHELFLALTPTRADPHPHTQPGTCTPVRVFVGEAPRLNGIEGLDAGGDLNARTIPAMGTSLPVRSQREFHVAFGLNAHATGRRGDPPVRPSNKFF